MGSRPMLLTKPNRARTLMPMRERIVMLDGRTIMERGRIVDPMDARQARAALEATHVPREGEDQ